MKACKKCKEFKPVSEYYGRADLRDGHVSECKQCCKSRYKAYYQKNKEGMAEYSAEY